jgi:hypothetical protein
VFLPGTTAAAFVVRDIPATHTATWTVAYQGTNTASVGIAFPVACLDDDGRPAGRPDPDDPNPPVTPPPLTPPTAASYELGVYVSCVSVRGDRYSATFGYINPGAQAFSIAVGADNQVRGAGAGAQGQPVTFLPGSHDAAFAITGLRLGAQPTWTVVLPSGQRIAASADPTAESCRSTDDEPTPPAITTVITPPKRAILVGTPGETTVVTRNNGTTPLYGVNVVIPSFPDHSSPIAIRTGTGITCPLARRSAPARGTRASTVLVCPCQLLLPGESVSVTLTTIPRAASTVTATTRPYGASPTNQRVDAADSGPIRAYGVLRNPVTG